jgi:hypothetical protein
VEQQDNSVGGSSGVNPPLRQVLNTGILKVLVQNDKSQFISGSTDDTLEKKTGCVPALMKMITKKRRISKDLRVTTRDEPGGR